MAYSTTLSNEALNAQAAALNTLLAGGKIKVYDGTQRASPESALSGNTLGVTLTLGSPAFSVSNGVMTANPIASNVAVATITPTWASIEQADGTGVMDVTAGATGCNLTISSIVSGISITCIGFTHTIKKITTGV